MLHGVFFQTSSSVLSSFSEKRIGRIGENTMVFLMMRATVFLLFVIDLDAAAANTVTSAKVLHATCLYFYSFTRIVSGDPILNITFGRHWPPSTSK